MGLSLLIMSKGNRSISGLSISQTKLFARNEGSIQGIWLKTIWMMRNPISNCKRIFIQRVKENRLEHYNPLKTWGDWLIRRQKQLLSEIKMEINEKHDLLLEMSRNEGRLCLIKKTTLLLGNENSKAELKTFING